MSTSYADVWPEYFETRKPDLRDGLVEYYTPHLTRIVASIFSKYKYRNVEYEDLYSYGMIGLLEAIERFVPNKEIKFETFSTYRIKGAILNGIETYNEKSAQLSSKSKIRKERIDSINRDLGSGISDLIDHVVLMTFTYILESREVYSNFGGTRTTDPNYEYICSKVRDVVAELPERERVIIQSHYFSGMSFDEIGDSLGIKKSRVSQIHKKILMKIYERYFHQKTLNDFL